MSKLKNKPLTKSLGPLLKEKGPKKTTIQVICAVFSYFGAHSNVPKKDLQRPTRG
jgi:hypothetical protein